MSKLMSLTFTENGTTAIAELLEKSAPRTCAVIWGCLAVPAVSMGIHSMYVGRGMAFNLPPTHQISDPQEVPPENQIIFPVSGDICFNYFRPYELNNPGHDTGSDQGVFDLTIFYGRNARMFASKGWMPSNLFANIVAGMEPFAAMCAKARNEGIKEIRIARADTRSS